MTIFFSNHKMSQSKKLKFNSLELFDDLPKPWFDLIEELVNKKYEKIKDLNDSVIEVYKNKKVCPDKCDLWKAFYFFPPSETKVVIVGQDPYFNGEACGLAFSCKSGFKVAPSLRNILKESKSKNKEGSLVSWCEQKVLLMNSVLTTERGKANAHKKLNWKMVTSRIIKELSKRNEHVIFVFWGLSAQEMFPFIENRDNHLILMSSHPSPFSAHSGFLGCGHFEKINEQLIEWGEKPIDW